MKIFTKPNYTLIFAAILISLSSALFAQSDFEGKIDYTITYTNLPPEMKAYESMLPKDMSIILKGNKSRIEQTQLMGTNIVVSDMDNKTGFIEMDMAGQKIRMNITKEEFDEEVDSAPKNIEYIDESKKIAGYDCKKAIMKDDEGNTAMTVYYTEEISNKAQKEFAGLKGFPLQYAMTQQNMSLEITASEVKKEAVPSSAFVKSEGFQEMSQEELQKMMGGGN